MELAKVITKGKHAYFTQKQVDRMRYMYSEGMRYPEIAKVFGVSSGTIAEYIKGKRIVKPSENI